MTEITISTRRSQLAMWQTESVAAILRQHGFAVRILSMETIGDRILDTSIAKIGSKGVFTEELEEQLRTGQSDIAVHSAKDMQSTLPEGFELIAFTEREKVNDVLVSRDRQCSLRGQARPLVIGTSSVRRVALLKKYYPQVQTVEMRGNLQTRIRKMDEGACDALLLAYAGVKRMGYQDLIVHHFALEEFIPPVGQGCIAIEAAAALDPSKKAAIRACLNHSDSEICLRAERAYLKKLEGGCSIPAFALATLAAGQLTLRGGLASLDGATVLRHQLRGASAQAEELGMQLAEHILAAGGRDILAAIRNAQH